MLLRLHIRANRWLKRRTYLTHSTVTASSVVGVFVVAAIAIGLASALSAWDLTQPQAVVLAAALSGPFLIFAAWLAFKGQAANRQDERDKFDEQMKFENKKFRSEMRAQRKQARSEAKRQTAQLTAQLAAASELEREKQRRERAFDLITQAISAVLALRTAVVGIESAADQDTRNLNLFPPTDPWGPDRWKLAQAATDEAERRRVDVSAVAAVLMVLYYVEPYDKLMDLANLVGTLINDIEPPYTRVREYIGPFMVAYGLALISLRGVYEPLASPSETDSHR